MVALILFLVLSVFGVCVPDELPPIAMIGEIKFSVVGCHIEISVLV